MAAAAGIWLAASSSILPGQDDPPSEKAAPEEPDALVDVSVWHHRGMKDGIPAGKAGWLPVYLEFSSRLKVSRTIHVEGMIWSKDGSKEDDPQFRTQSAIELPAGSKKRMWVYLRYGPEENGSGGVQTASVKASIGGKECFRQRWQFFFEHDDDREKDSPMGLVSGEHIQASISPWGDSVPRTGRSGMNKRSIHSRKLDAVPERWLPDDPLGYQTLDFLILRNFNENEMEDSQIEAIRDWVFLGGWVILVPSSNGAIFSTRLARMLFPEHAAGQAKGEDGFQPGALVHRLKDREPVPSSRWWGADQEAPRLGFTRIDPITGVEGRSIHSVRRGAGESAAPEQKRLYQEFEFGSGKVGFLTIDDQSGSSDETLEFRQALWRMILDSGLEDAERTPRWTGQVGAFQNEPAVGFLKNGLSPELGIWFLAGLVVVYLVIIGPGVYFVLKRMRRLPWVVWVEPSIAAVYVAMIFIAGHLIRGVLNQSRTISILSWKQGERLAEKESYLGIFSSKEGRYRISAPGCRWLRPVFSNAQEEVNVRFTGPEKPAASARPRTIDGFRLDLWQTGVFAALDVVPLRGPLEIRQSMEPAKEGPVSVDILNQTGFSITQGFVFDERRNCYAFGAISPGAAIRLENGALKAVNLTRIGVRRSAEPPLDGSPEDAFAYSNDPLLGDLVRSLLIGSPLFGRRREIALMAILDRRDDDFTVDPGATLMHRADLLLVYR